MPRAFFFPHSVEQRRVKTGYKGSPSRVPMAVEGTQISADGVREQARGSIISDGYWPHDGSPQIGSNQDPCVFSSPGPPLHAFCRVAKVRGADNNVIRRDGTAGALLPREVGPGDVIVYGKPRRGAPTLAVDIDTVLVVDRSRPIRELLAEADSGSDVFLFNLMDALPGGLHEGAGASNSLAIVGRIEPSWSAAWELRTSFVPHAERTGDGKWCIQTVREADLDPRLARALRPALVEAIFSGPEQLAAKGRLVELPYDGAVALVRALLLRRDAKAFIPPLKPVRATHRWDPRSGGSVPADQYTAQFGHRPEGW